MTFTFFNIDLYAGSVANSSASFRMWLVDDTSLACCRPVMKIVGLYAEYFATDISSLCVGSVISITEMSRPRYECPALYAFTSGYAASCRTIASDSSGLMM